MVLPIRESIWIDIVLMNGDHKWRAADRRSAEKRGLQQKLLNQSRVWVQARASWLLFADYENPMNISRFNRNNIYRCWHLHLWFPEAVADLIQSIVGDNNQPRVQIPSGEQPHSNGKSPILMGKSTISMAIFHCYVSSPEGIWYNSHQTALSPKHH